MTTDGKKLPETGSAELCAANREFKLDSKRAILPLEPRAAAPGRIFRIHRVLSSESFEARIKSLQKFPHKLKTFRRLINAGFPFRTESEPCVAKPGRDGNRRAG
jgi:hypothetical protein